MISTEHSGLISFNSKKKIAFPSPYGFVKTEKHRRTQIANGSIVTALKPISRIIG